MRIRNVRLVLAPLTVLTLVVFGIAAPQSRSSEMRFLSVFVNSVVGSSSTPNSYEYEDFTPVTTTLYLSPLKGLAAPDFKVYQDGVRQTIQYVSPPSGPGPLGIVVGLGTRGPVRSPELQDPAFGEISNAVNLLRTSGADSFVDSAPWESQGIYDVVLRTLAKVQQHSNPRKAMVIISDGTIPRDRGTEDAGKKLIEAAKGVDFPIHFLFIGRERSDSYAAARTFRETAEVTGGAVFVADSPGTGISSRITFASEQILFKLSGRYVVGFVPAKQTRDGRWRKVSVKVDAPQGTRRIGVQTPKPQYFDGPIAFLADSSPPELPGLRFPEPPLPQPRSRAAMFGVITPGRDRIGDTTKLLERASVDTVLPGGASLLEELWKGGNWQTVQYETGAYTATGFKDRIIVKTSVAFERPDKLSVEMKVLEGQGTGRVLKLVSNGELARISNSATGQYFEAHRTPPAELLRSLDEMLLHQLPDALNIGTSGLLPRPSDLFADLRKGSEVLPLRTWSNTSTLRSESIEIEGRHRDCWVLTGNVGEGSYNTRVIWIDKELSIPLRVGMLREAIPEKLPNATSIYAQPHFYEIQTESLRVNEPIPASVFVLDRGN